MSSIGSHIAASVAAQALTERQAVASKVVREQEAARLRRELRDLFSPSAVPVEEGGAVAGVAGDEESPADARDRQRSGAQEHELSPGPGPKPEPGTLDVRA